jgi:hypothetical protein
MPVLSLLDRILVAFVVRSDRGIQLVRGVPHSLRIIRTNPHPELGPMALNVLPIGCSESHIGVPVGEECLLPTTVCTLPHMQCNVGGGST